MSTAGWELENMLPESFKTVTKGCLQFCIQVFHFSSFIKQIYTIEPSACCATVESQLRKISADV